MKKTLFALRFSIFSFVSLSQQDGRLDQFFSSSNKEFEAPISSSERIEAMYNAYLEYHALFDPDREFESFAYQQNFFMERLNRSGAVFHDNEISDYLNRLKDLILTEAKDRAYIKVYLTDFDQVNAFTNDFGKIYVNIATVAKLSSEEELIVVLAHEIAHVLSRHSIKFNEYIENLSNDDIEDDNELFEFSYHRFSQKQELEADSIAYKLIQNLGINLGKVKRVFQHLNHDQNPVFSNRIDICELSTQKHVQTYLCELSEHTYNEEVFSTLVKPEDDSLTTHPSIEAREKLFDSFNFDSLTGSTLTQDFMEMKELAAFVLVKTYLTEDRPIDALYLVRQLKHSNPNNAYLAKSELKALLMITQNKYNMNIPLVNIYGNSCNDSTFLTFRRAILKIPALEMNLILLESIQDYRLSFNDTYIERIENFAYEFLYKYNPALFEANENGIKISTEKVYSDYSYAFGVSNVLGNDELSELKKLKKQGYLVIENPHVDERFAKAYFEKFDGQRPLNEAAISYRKRRNAYESNLTIDMLLIEKNRDEAIKKYRKGKSSKFEGIDSTAIVGLGEIYVMLINEDNLTTIPYQQMLHLEERILGVMRNEEIYDLYFSGAGIEFGHNTISGYDRRMMSTWFHDGFRLKDLFYSAADEEITNFRRQEKIDFLAYHSIFSTKSGRKIVTFYYTLYFDIETMGVVYVNKMMVEDKKEIKDNYLRHYLTTIRNESY